MKALLATVPLAAALLASGCSSAAPSDEVRGAGSSQGQGGSDAGASNTSGGVPGQGGSGGNGEATRRFTHPGLLHTTADFARMKAKVKAGESPWSEGYARLTENSHASLDWTPNPHGEIHRNDGVNADNAMDFAHDVAAAYACAVRFHVGGDSAYADKAVEIVNAWTAVLTKITWSDGHYDGFLVAGIQGYQFANVIEILRDYPGFSGSDLARAKRVLLDVFWPMVGRNGTSETSLSVYSSWDLAAMTAAFAIAVVCEDWEKLDDVIDFFERGLGNGALTRVVNYVHPGYLGQTQESGRDQGHNTLSISLLTNLAEMAWNQGIDLYGYDNSRILAGAEYVARGNSKEGESYRSVPFSPYTNGNVLDTQFSSEGVGNLRPEWAMILNHYENRRGIRTPFVESLSKLVAPEGGGGDYGPNSGGFDQLGYGTLTFTREPFSGARHPSGLTARSVAGNTELSFWGCVGAESYSIKHSTKSGGPYTTIATGITDPLTLVVPMPLPGRHYYVAVATLDGKESAASNEAIVESGVVARSWFRFDESSGDALTDAGPNVLEAHLVGSASRAAGRSKSALSLDGEKGYVEIVSPFFEGTSDFSIAAWVYWNGGSSNQRIFDFGTGRGEYMYLTPSSGSGKLRFAITTNLGLGEQALESPSSLPSGKWVQVVITLSGSHGELYVDGTLAASSDAIFTAPFRLGKTDKNYLGRSQYEADPFFSGLIDDFRIYSGAVAPSEFSKL